MRPIDANPTDLKTVRKILDAHVPEIEVRAFGSRVSWTARETSDLDLALMTDEPLDTLQMALLREAFTNSDLPFRVDIVDWATTSSRFRKVIERDYVVLRASSKSPDKVSGWQHTTLGAVIDLLSGGTPSKSKTEYWDGTIPWVSAKDMKRFRLRDTRDHLTTEGATNGTKVVPADTVLMLTRGMTLLNDLPICVIEQAMAFNQDVKALRLKDGVLVDFLPYLMLGNKTSLLSLVDLAGHGTGRLNSEELKALDIQLPPLPEQRAIAHVLGTLDDKIDLNRRMNETLEAMARAIFKDWFVDFGPVRAKMEGCDTGLPDRIAALFPDRMVESELGEVPEGWAVKPLKDCFNFTMGQSPPGSSYNEEEEGLPFFQGRTDFGFRYPENRKYCTAPTRIAERDDTLVSVRAPVGDINMAWEKCCIGRGVAAFRHYSGSRSFTYYSAWAMQHELKEYEHTGTVFGAINKKQFEEISVVNPTPEVVSLFENEINLLDERIRENISERRTLAQTRDILLSKLVSGEVRLHESEIAVRDLTSIHEIKLRG